MKSNCTFFAKFILSFCIVFSSFYTAKATQGLGVLNISLVKDTLAFSDTIRGTAILYNYDSFSTYVGKPVLKYTVNGLLSNDSLIIPTPDTLDIQPQSGAQFSFKIPVLPPAFKVGPDVVIIWPITTTPAHDSTHFNVWILAPNTGIEEKSILEFSLKASNNSLKLNFGENRSEVKRVSIYSILGTTIFDATNGLSDDIPFSNQASGIYFCEVLWENKERKVIQFYKN